MQVIDYAPVLTAIPRRRDQLLPALHAVHHVAGWLPEGAIEAAARHVFVPLSEVYGIITSYSEFRLSPPEPDRVEICTGLSCLLAGAERLAELAAAAGRPTERVPCRFLCGVAPVSQADGVYRGRGMVHPAPRPHASGVNAAPVSRPADGDAGHAGRAAFPSSSTTSMGKGRGDGFDRGEAFERAQTLAARVRITVADGLCARAAGNRAALDAAMAGAAMAGGAGPLVVRTGCDGACHAQPIVTVQHPDGSMYRFERVTAADRAAVVAAVQGRGMPAMLVPDPARRVLRNCGVIDPESLDEALAAGGYAGLEQALALKPEELVELVRASGLRGRGGAYFPTAVKWTTARSLPGPRYLVVNAEEGEPGVFKDRHLMEGDPHALIEGTLIAAYAVGAERAYLYINGQAELSAQRVEQALARARESGLLGESILGSTFSCEIEVYRGAGGYVCGEESVILNSIEGERAVPRYRPPLPVEAGLWGRPTVINNVETLVNLPLILTQGPDWFREAGSEQFPGTKLMSLSGALARPGLYEVPMGTTLRAIIETWGGGAEPGHTITALVTGGPSGGLLPAAMLDVPIAGGMLHPTGAVLGAGGMVALDERTPVALALRELTAYNKAESCGKCTPCREGSERALAILDRAGGELTADDRELLLQLCDVLQTASLCGLGQMAPGPIRSWLTLFEPAPGSPIPT